MADVAMVFHWPPSDLEQMEVEDLMTWREKARQRHEQQTQERAGGR